MRVTLCVDALESQLGGIGRYTWELCKGLRDDRRVTAVRYFGRNQLLDDPALLVRGGILKGPWRRFRKLQNWGMRRTLSNSLFHGPNYFLPPFIERGIITVHDLSVFRYPETHPAERVAAFERGFASSLGRAMHVLTDTETVRRELIETFSLPETDVTAVTLGVDSHFHPRGADELEPLLAAWGLRPGRYALCVSALEPRKKIGELLAAWRRLPPSIRDRWPLVLAGGSGWRNESLRTEIEAGLAEGWLQHLGFVAEDVLPALYAGAALFVYPSIYEGFGLPPLEAMASGVPVIVSDRSCLPEVSGDAALYIDPDDPEGFTAALERGLTDEEWRADSTARGLERARLFRWDRCIDATIGVYQSVDRNR